MLSLALQLTLAGVFVVAAATKLSDRAGTREAAAGFGAPEAVAGIVAVALPLVELGVAAALLVAGPAGPVTALGLLGLLSALVVANLASGNRPDCHCFGTLGSEPIGAATLARNAGLAAIAAILLLGPPDGSVDVAPGSFAAGFGLAAVLAAPLVIVLLRRHGQALLRADLLAAELAEGRRAPDLRALAGLPGTGRPLVAVFTAEGCEPCARVKPRLDEWRAEHAGRLDLAELDYDAHREAASECGVAGTPAAVVIAADGLISSEPAHGPEQIDALVTALTDDPATREPLLDRVPADGLELTRDSLLVFWDPACGYCDAMRPQVEAVAADAAGPAVLVVSSADAQRTAIVAPVKHDAQGDLAGSLGVLGTPSAVLVAPDGAVRSKLVVGADAILALIAEPPPLQLEHVGGAHAR